MYEPRHEPLLPPLLFWVRMGRHLLAGFAVLLLALGIGMLGYWSLEGMAPVDAFLNAAMILAGMGPVDVLHTQSGKLFAGAYALFSGLVFTGLLAFVFAPVLHRFLHKFHIAQRSRDLQGSR